MTESNVLFDTWAWWEILMGTPKGDQLRRRYLAEGRRINTSVLTLAEISLRLSVMGDEASIGPVLANVHSQSHIRPVDARTAEKVGPLRQELRKKHRDASLVDALIRATATELDVALISADPAFRDDPDVRDH